MVKSAIKYFYPTLLINIRRIKIILETLICLLITPFIKIIFKNRRIWLIGENIGECLKDNGYCLFKYCIENNIVQDVFFLAAKKSIKDDIYLSSIRNVICYGSMRNILYLFLADVYIFTHTHQDIAPHKLFLLIAKRKKTVFLQHGVTGFKKFNDFYNKYNKEPNILVVVSDFEKSIFTDQVGIEKDNVKITGFARYDYLSNTAPFKIQKQIAYIPTYRDWLENKNFLDSEFYKQISSFMMNKSLAESIEKNNIILKLYLHKNMKDCISFFSSNSNNIHLINFGQESVQQMIKESSLLITDYSSISWDFYYLGKPVIFYQFDIDDYLNNRGSYLDLKKDIFGDIVNSEKDLAFLINHYIENNFQANCNNNTLKSNFFKYLDKSNCGRIYQEILKL